MNFGDTQCWLRYVRLTHQRERRMLRTCMRHERLMRRDRLFRGECYEESRTVRMAVLGLAARGFMHRI